MDLRKEEERMNRIVGRSVLSAKKSDAPTAPNSGNISMAGKRNYLQKDNKVQNSKYFVFMKKCTLLCTVVVKSNNCIINTIHYVQFLSKVINCVKINISIKVFCADNLIILQIAIVTIGHAVPR